MRKHEIQWPTHGDKRRKYLREQRYLARTAKLNAMPLWY